MAKVIIFTAYKGGGGKSMLCTLFAHALAATGAAVTVLDADAQQSIARQRQADAAANPDYPLPWAVRGIYGRPDIPALLSAAKQAPGCVLIDCPGGASNTQYIASADVIVVPFKYDFRAADSTLQFEALLRAHAQGAQILYVANMIIPRAHYPDRDALIALLHGQQLGELPVSAHLERLDTLSLAPKQRAVSKGVTRRFVNLLTQPLLDLDLDMPAPENN